jgi:hypothetical protein
MPPSLLSHAAAARSLRGRKTRARRHVDDGGSLPLTQVVELTEAVMKTFIESPLVKSVARIIDPATFRT